MNSDLDDIADALTDSVASDGQTLMTGALQAFAGTAAAPGIGFVADPDTGMYRKAANSIGFAAGGAEILNVVGTGIAIVGTVTATSGLLPFPSGTRLLFQQTAAPTGWTKDTTHNDKALRVVSGTVTAGGTTPFTTVFAARTISQANLPNVTLTTTIAAGQGSHSHGTQNFESDGGGGTRSGTGAIGSAPPTALATLPAMSGTTPLGGSGTAMDFAVQYVDCILAQKD